MPSIPPISDDIITIYMSEHPVIDKMDVPEDMLIVNSFDAFQQAIYQQEFTYFYFDNESITWIDNIVLQRLYNNEKVIVAIDVPLSTLTQRLKIRPKLVNAKPLDTGNGFILSYVNKLQEGLSANNVQFTDYTLDLRAFHEALKFSHTSTRCSMGEIPKSVCQ